MEGELGNQKRVRVDSDELQDDSPYVKRLREDLLNDDSDLCTASEDLDSFMKSFEEEISGSPTHNKIVDLTLDAGDSRPDLDYLLEASDDELGLPPSNSSPLSLVENQEEVTELVRDSNELSGFWGFDEQIPGYDSVEFGIGESDGYENSINCEYVAFDGLFDDSDIGFGSDLWRPETLPTL